MAEMKAWFSRTRAKYRLQGELTIVRIKTSNDWPKLKSKATQLRCLSRFALELARKHDSGSQHDRRRSGVAQLLVRFYEIVEQEGLFLSDAAVREIKSIGKDLPMLYIALASEAALKQQRLWKAQPKMHLFQHLCEWQVPMKLNPRIYWTYADEDLVGKLIEVASACHPYTVQSTALF